MAELNTCIYFITVEALYSHLSALMNAPPPGNVAVGCLCFVYYLEMGKNMNISFHICFFSLSFYLQTATAWTKTAHCRLPEERLPSENEAEPKMEEIWRTRSSDHIFWSPLPSWLWERGQEEKTLSYQSVSTVWVIQLQTNEMFTLEQTGSNFSTWQNVTDGSRWQHWNPPQTRLNKKKTVPE